MKVFIFDTETTGLIENHVMDLKKQPEVIQFYGHNVNLKTGRVLGTPLETFIRPREFPRSEYTIKVTKTKITDDQLEKAPSFKRVAGSIRAAIEASEVIIAHNLSFDREMIDIEFERLGEKITWPKRMICTVESTVYLHGRRLTLSQLYAMFFDGAKFEAHLAKEDVEALTKISIALFKKGIIA